MANRGPAEQCRRTCNGNLALNHAEELADPNISRYGTSMVRQRDSSAQRALRPTVVVIHYYFICYAKRRRFYDLAAEWAKKPIEVLVSKGILRNSGK